MGAAPTRSGSILTVSTVDGRGAVRVARRSLLEAVLAEGKEVDGEV